MSDSVSLFPLFLKLEGKRCLVVGAGLVGLEKVESLLRCGASTFSRPIRPAPTTRHRFPSSFRNKGKRLTLSLKVFTADRGRVSGYRLKDRAGQLLT